MRKILTIGCLVFCGVCNAAPDKVAHNWWTEADSWVAVGTVALAAVTFSLAFFTYRLWRSTGELVKDARDSSQRELRAYMCMDGGSITRQTPSFFRTAIQFTNSGKTPAHNVRTLITQVVSDKPPSDRSTAMQPHARGVYGPRTPLHLVIDQNFTPEVIADVESGKKNFYVWGRVEYTDVFGHKQRSEFRHVGHKINGVPGWAVAPEDQGNEAT